MDAELQEEPMFDTVVVPLDGSESAERALGPAVALARRAGAAVVPLQVVTDERLDEHGGYLEKVAASLDVATHPPYVIPTRDAAEAIANAGEAPGALVVMTTHGSSGLRRATLGSVAEATVRRLSRPMVLIGPSCPTTSTFDRRDALVPLDGSARADLMVPIAGEWCRLLDLRPWAVTVVDPEAQGGRAGPAETAHVRHTASRWEEEGLTAGFEVLHGDDPSGPLVTFGAGLPAAMAMMTTHGRTGLARLTLGSVATHVVHDIPCPVLVHRPQDLEYDEGEDS
jgi:nucleotide-binding universal stress UspA family protein